MFSLNVTFAFGAPPSQLIPGSADEADRPSAGGDQLLMGGWREVNVFLLEQRGDVSVGDLGCLPGSVVQIELLTEPVEEVDHVLQVPIARVVERNDAAISSAVTM